MTRKHIRVDVGAIANVDGGRRPVVDPDATETAGELAIDPASIRVTIQTNGTETAGGGPFVQVRDLDD